MLDIEEAESIITDDILLSHLALLIARTAVNPADPCLVSSYALLCSVAITPLVVLNIDDRLAL